MKKKDINNITTLRVNGRISLTELSRNTGLPVSTIHERLKQHVQTGLLHPTTLITFSKLGFYTRAYILLGVHTREKEKLLSYLSQEEHVNSLFCINNGWTALMECVFRDMYTLEQFIENLETMFTVKQKQVCYVLNELKREAFFSDKAMADKLIPKN